MSGYPHETLSYSSINEFTGYGSCQRRWWYKRIANQPPDRLEGQQLALGTAFDAAAMAAFEAKIQGDEMPADQAIQLMIEAWNEQMESGRYEIDQWGSNLPGLAPSAVRQLVTDVVPRLRPKATQHPVRIKFDEVDWEFAGKIDLLAESDTTPGTEVVLDTKATASSSTKYVPAADLQLNLYAMTREMEGAGATTVSETGFIVGRMLKTKAEVLTPRAPHSPAAYTQALDLLNTTSKAVETACESGNFPPTAFLQRSWRCSEKFCEFFPTTCDYGARARTTFAIPGKDDET